MSTIKTNLAGLDGLRARIGALSGAARRGAGAGLRDLAEATAADLRRSLPRAPPGTPSRPGLPPGDPEGRIAAAITVEDDGGRAGASVVVDLPFAQDLEFGTSRVAARPFLRPAAARAAEDARRLLARRLDDAVKERGP